MKISIVTPSYNQAEFIERTIRSILDQNYSDLEYIVMDGGSTDGTVGILKKYDGKIIWKSEKDNGQSDAINKGLKMVAGDIVAYLNSDDTYEPGTLAKAAKFFKKNPEIKWAYGRCKIIDENDKEIRKWITAYKNLLGKNFSYPKLLAENFICQPATFWRRELLDEIGYFNEKEHFCMDYEFWLRAGQKYPAGAIPEHLANFRYYSNSKSGSVNKKQFQDELRLAKQFGKDYRFSIVLHKFNYFKITAAYQLISVINEIASGAMNDLKKIYRKFLYLIKLTAGEEVYFPIQTDASKEFMGSKKYGGWFVCPDRLDEKSVVYSFGIGEDISFDLDIIKKIGCKVLAFDPTPKSIAWLKKQILPKKFSYCECGLADYDGVADFFPPKNSNHVSCSLIPRNDSKNRAIKVKVKRLKSILNKFGHKKINLLKLDIEGAEYDVLKDIMDSKIDVDQILVEFHHRLSGVGANKTRQIIKKLNCNGYKIFAISPTREEYSFIKIK